MHENREKVATGSPNEGLSIVAPSHTSFLKKAVLFIGHVAAKIGLSERRTDVRVSVRKLDVNYVSGAQEKRANIKDISPTGAYLLTDHRWIVGTTLLLTMQSRSRKHRNSPTKVRLQAKVVRIGKDGVGVSFVHEHADTAQWLTFVSKATSLISEEGAVRVFRMAKGLAFLLRISPFAEDPIIRLFCESLSEERIEGALDIVLSADELLASRNATPKNTMLPRLLLRILADGSKSNEESIQQCWTGLLATSSLEGSNDDENLGFVALLSKLEAVHVRILAAAGERAVHAGFQSAMITSQELHCRMEEIKRITETRNVAVIECALNRLYEFGLLELTIKPFGCASLDHANLMPTKLGLAFYQAYSAQQKPPDVLDLRSAEVAS